MHWIDKNVIIASSVVWHIFWKKPGANLFGTGCSRACCCWMVIAMVIGEALLQLPPATSLSMSRHRRIIKQPTQTSDPGRCYGLNANSVKLNRLQQGNRDRRDVR